jgi:hypothetical protein
LLSNELEDKELSHLLVCLFVLIYFLALLEAMNESALDKLKREAREKEL